MPAEQNQPLGPTEELLAKAQAEAIAQSQQPASDNQVEADTQPDPLFEHTTAGMTNAQEQQPEQQEPFSILQAPQDEGTRSHPTPETSPVAPGKEQHQQAVAEEMGEPGGGMKRTISTKTQLGAVVTLDGAYSVPRYQTVIKETPLPDKGEGGKQRVSVLKDLAKEQSRRDLRQEPEQNRERDRDRGMER